MSIIKERIKFNNQDIILKINLGDNIDFSGYQQEIDNLTNDTKEELINPVIDNEVRRFNYNVGSSDLSLSFYFSNILGTGNYNSFIATGFDIGEVVENSNKMRNSFFILEYYDDFNNNTQTKIFTTYNTQIFEGETLSGAHIPKYLIGDDVVNQFYHLNIPQSYLDTETGSTAIGYIKFSFYNAKTGRISVFYNKANEGLKTPEKMYFRTTLNLNTRKWAFDSDEENAYELPINNTYANRVNDAVDNFDNLQQNPPDGVFNPEDGKYDIQ